VPTWAWALLAVVLIVGVGYRGMLRAQYYKGIADAAAEEARAQTELVTQAGARSDSLAAELDQLGAELLERTREDSLRLEELDRTRARARIKSDSLESELSSRLDSLQTAQLELLIVSHRAELAAVGEALAIETEGRRAQEVLVARSSQLLLEQRTQIELLEQRDSTRLVEIEALREATGGLSLSVTAGWLTGGVGVVLGYAIATVVQR
tara:strand:- start:121 stop:747 length:627 start_codon:yes stop_codon:yes gene_type:complete